MVTFRGTSLLVTSRSYLTTGQPAEPSDMISILGTGIGSGTAQSLEVQIADSYVATDSVQAMPGMAGVSQVNVKLPAGGPVGDAIPVVLVLTGSDGKVIRSNPITIAIEPARQ